MKDTTSPRQSATATRRAILAAGRVVFLRDGYEASLDTVAREAGVSRRSVFNQFVSKEGLFKAIIDEMSREADPILELDERLGLRDALLAHAQRYVGLVTSPETAMIQRMLLSGAPGMAENMKRVLDRNYNKRIGELARYIRVQIAGKRMRKVHPERSAERFLTSVLGLARLNVMLGIETSMRERMLYIEEAVDAFIDSVGVNAPAGR